ncbi:MAG TPA: DUF1553 domain-containing protein [Verrucomicrobiota bacterium]|nr:DUF1553 domain-containing protein [Verrucomicrobiota bacterium]
MRTVFSTLIITGFVLAANAADLERVDYNFQVKPLLSDRCYRCHGPDAGSRKAKLRLDTREGALKKLDNGWAVVKPGDPAKSELIARIFTDNEDDLMPPTDSHLKLSDAEKQLLKRWVEEGAEYKPHWAFIPVKPVAPPAPRNTKWARNPIDAFILSRLETEKLAPSPEASREILVRRVAFDLTGLPPGVSEIDAFLEDKSPDAYERMVGRFLQSPAYGERMAMDWLDLARFADTYGYQNDVERDMSPWRDWVIKAFNENLSYDQFLLWQLAGDLLPKPTREQRLATALNRLNRQTNEGGSIDEEFRTEYAADRLHTVGTAMLGLTMECARCHDHKFDPISQRDYYSMFAFFNSIDESGTYSHFTRATPGPAMLLWPEEKSAEVARLKLRMVMADERARDIAAKSRRTVNAWLKSGGKILQPQPVAHFTFDEITTQVSTNGTTNYFTANALNVTNLAKLVDDPAHVDESPASSAPRNRALQFSGDNELQFKGIAHFRRTDEFSFNLWLKPAESQPRAVVLHHSQAAQDAGSRGYELLLEDGKPAFGLIHFWPGNAIKVRAKQALPLNQWSQITVTYDGSSRADGIRLYLNGKPLETDIIRDNLYKDIVHRKEWNDTLVGKINLTLAGRFRDSGFKNGAIDELEVFDVCLTDAEIAARTGRASSVSDEAMKAHYLARHDESYRAAVAELKQLRERENELVNDVPEIMVMKELEQPRPAFLLERGAYDSPGEPVQRDTPASVMPFLEGQPRNRLGLANWMIDPQNPLTSRVVVNRVWRMHFGRGIVTSQEDFGVQGKLPSHPELLDWLAGWFMENGWDMKALHRLLLTSATYRQSSSAPDDLLDRDPDNVLLARGPKHRLLAEQIRDSALAASGLLNPKLGGPSVKPYQPEGLWEEAGTGAKYTQDKGDKLYRRSLYTFWKRTAPPPSMLTFDATSREVCTAKRESTTTPLQALVLLNDPQFVEAARALGERLLRENPSDLNARIRGAYRSLTGREPDTAELSVMRRLFEQQQSFYAQDTDAAEQLLSVGESPWDKSLPRADFAATTVMVSAVINMDEFVMLR